MKDEGRVSASANQRVSESRPRQDFGGLPRHSLTPSSAYPFLSVARFSTLSLSSLPRFPYLILNLFPLFANSRDIIGVAQLDHQSFSLPRKFKSYRQIACMLLEEGKLC